MRTLSRPAVRVIAWGALLAGLGCALAVAAVQRDEEPAAEDPCRNGYVGLTYDDGPSVSTTTELLEALSASGLRATMFNQGNNAQAHPDLVREQQDAGMWVGNHTFTHPHLPEISEASVLQEIADTQRVLTNITGQAPTLFRPPYGETSDRVRRTASELDLLEVLWTVDSRDWADASATEIVAAAATLKPGGIIVMHEWAEASIDAVPGIADVLADKGLCAGRIAAAPGDIACETCFGAVFHAVAVDPEAAPVE
jgi:peptidoglycan/xylan/chitin deacetylase (PgdA/CDA1 family)